MRGRSRTGKLCAVSEFGVVRYASSGDVSIAYQVIGDGPRDLIYVPGIVSGIMRSPRYGRWGLVQKRATARRNWRMRE